MARGKRICNILKEIRRQIAEANDIKFTSAECDNKHDCLGTCPKCEEEVRYLEQQLQARSNTGKSVNIEGVSAESFSMLIDRHHDTQADRYLPAVVKSNLPVVADTIMVRGVAICHDCFDESFKERLSGVKVINKRTLVFTISDNEGKFELPAAVGDTLEGRYDYMDEYICYESHLIVVTDDMKDSIITLDIYREPFEGELVK